MSFNLNTLLAFTLLSLLFPFLKLALALFGFKECADVGEHIVHDGLQDVFRHIAFGTAVAKGVFKLHAQARPEATELVRLNAFPARSQAFGNGFLNSRSISAARLSPSISTTRSLPYCFSIS